jgi:hypothetical protein
VLYSEKQDELEQKESITNLTLALEFWKQYVASTLQQIKNPL